MRILLVNQFYPPDMAPTGQHLHDVGRGLVARGHEVTALCSRRSYDGGGGYAAREVRDGVRVHRLPALGFGRRGAARAADYLSFHAATLLGGGHDRPFDISRAEVERIADKYLLAAQEAGKRTHGRTTWASSAVSERKRS